MFDTQIEDLKLQIIQVKKQNLRLRQENDTLKIKTRKLEDSMSQKHRLIDNLIDPQKTSTFRKEISEHGASMILIMKEENERLRNKLKQSEQTIKRLQKDVDSSKAYLSNKSWVSVKAVGSKSDLPTQRSSKHIECAYKKQQSHIPTLNRRAISAERSSKPQKTEYTVHRSRSAKASIKKSGYKVSNSESENCQNDSEISQTTQNANESNHILNKNTDADTDCSEFDSEPVEDDTKIGNNISKQIVNGNVNQHVKSINDYLMRQVPASHRILAKRNSKILPVINNGANDEAKHNSILSKKQSLNKNEKVGDNEANAGKNNLQIDKNDEINEDIKYENLKGDGTNIHEKCETPNFSENSAHHSSKSTKLLQECNNSVERNNANENNPSGNENVSRKLRPVRNSTYITAYEIVDDDLVDDTYKGDMQTSITSSIASQTASNANINLTHACTMTALPKYNTDIPHTEISRLHTYFKSIISEVKVLKDSISSVKREQEKTTSVLKDKDSNLEKLASEVKMIAMNQQLKNMIPQIQTPSNLQIFRAIEMQTSRNRINSRQHSAHESPNRRTPRQQYKVISQPITDYTVNILTKQGRTKCTENEIEEEMSKLGFEA